MLAVLTALSCLFPLSSLLWPATGYTAPVAAAPSPAPRPAAGVWLLVDHHSGAVLSAHDADKPVAPASLAKLMTAYLLFERLRAGRLKPEERVRVSTRAAGLSGARLFLRAESTATVDELLKGMLVRSANDATLALVEHVAGSEDTFVTEMNRKARELGLTQTAYVNATGLDGEGQQSTAREITRLASRVVRDFPEQYALFAVREFTFNDIRQFNRNALLWRDGTVDGIKTGRTRDAGYCVVASARRGPMRLIATVLGATDEGGRVEGAQRLLDWGFGNYETRLLYAANAEAARVRVWMGDANVLRLGVDRDLYLTLPRGLHERLRARLTVSETQFAPIRKGQAVGTLALDVDGQPYGEHPLVALAEIERGSVLERALDQVRLWLQ